MSIIDMLIVNMVIASAGAQPAHPRHAAQAHRGDTIAHATLLITAPGLARIQAAADVPGRPGAGQHAGIPCQGAAYPIPPARRTPPGLPYRSWSRTGCSGFNPQRTDHQRSSYRFGDQRAPVIRMTMLN
jgi:hypothetical protein